MKPTSQNDRCRDPFDDALDAVISGGVTPQDVAILNETLRIDADARRRYITEMAFEGMLAREFSPSEQSAPIPEPRRLNRWLAVGGIAAAVILGSTLAWRMNFNNSANSAEGLADEGDETSHAVITTINNNASGRFGNSQISEGMRLSRGLLQLDRGVVEITFDTGAEVTLEGPAKLQVESESKSRLTAGRASAYCPEQARGFVMITPSSYIRDLGTAFSVEVRDGMETDLHVLEGVVEAAATGRQATPLRILRQREAVRMAAGRMSPINFRLENPGQQNKPAARKIPASVHWSFDSWDGNTSTDSARGHVLTLLKNNKPVAPDLLDGPFGSAVHFDGQRTFASSNYPGVGGSQARTITCWLRLQADEGSADRGPNGIVAWGLSRSSGSWQLGWNTNSRQGTVGAPRVEFGEGYVVASTDLRDARWHHIAVVHLAGPGDIANHLKIYVDGKLESITGRRGRLIDTDIVSMDARPLTLGRYLGVTRGRSPFLFEGDIDELCIFEGSLLPKQIVRMMNKNALQPPKP